MASPSKNTSINEDDSESRNLNKDIEKVLEVSTSGYPAVQSHGDERKKEEKGSEKVDQRIKSKQLSSEAASINLLETTVADKRRKKCDDTSSISIAKIENSSVLNWRDKNFQYQREGNYPESHHRKYRASQNSDDNLSDSKLGSWSLIGATNEVEENGIKQSKNIWIVIENIYKKYNNVFVKYPRMSYLKNGSNAIICFIEDNTYEEILNVASIIRENLPSYPYALVYKSNKKHLLSPTNKVLYECEQLPDRKFYKMVLPDISSESRPFGEKGSEDRPSLVTIKKYAYYPESFEEESNDAKEKGGKWMIYAHGSYDKLDYNWLYLKELVDNEILVALKSCTGFEGELGLGGVTMCYTSDSENTFAVKMAADEIRKLIGHDEILYYKTNEASAQGKYLHENCINVSQYMYTVSHNGEGVLSKRDDFERWCPLNV